MRNIGVSTHSRPKAAGCTRAASIGRIFRFNTQPPEGGWDCNNFDSLSGGSFNTQPPEGGWPRWSRLRCFLILFQHTAARRRLAAIVYGVTALVPFQHTAARRRLELFSFLINTGKFSFNTQPPEGGWGSNRHLLRTGGSFNTQPPEGGWTHKTHITHKNHRFQHTAARRRLDVTVLIQLDRSRFQHTAARRRLDVTVLIQLDRSRFQHTAARRRLGLPHMVCCFRYVVSTHSRPKAAGSNALLKDILLLKFQHTAARRRLD